MGEGFGRWKLKVLRTKGPDEDLMRFVDAANIACGFHAGDPSIMLRTVQLCKKHRVKAGAHPGLQDLIGFGRRKIEMNLDDLHAMILYQVGALKAMLDVEGVELSHIKPHGELYFYMQREEPVMRAVLEACAPFNVPVYACRNEKQQAVCDHLGIPFQQEVYVDIDYSAKGELLPVSKSKPTTPEICASRFRLMAEQDQTRDIDDNLITLGFNGKPFSVCLHSDMPGALENARKVRQVVDEVNRNNGVI
ncbi:hypothetical protein H2204_004837 [Knufia peltigerae]|uniref:LamB/YcsF family protein n=1 Tax=Knufia peltigerae TaxID=1002370 RepID=A0AA39CY66_9EURO|nr:hypothetical protein H2204_004837 [Knufia peltigerae]